MHSQSRHLPSGFFCLDLTFLVSYIPFMSKENLESPSLLVTVWLQADTKVALSSGDKVLRSGGHPGRRDGGVFPLGLLCSLGLEATPCSLHHLGSSPLVSSWFGQ